MAKITIDKSQIEKIKAGSLKAFASMLTLLEKPVFGYVFGMVGHKETAEDLTQEVFIKVFKNRQSIEPEKDLTAWIYKIAANTVRDHWRRQNREKLDFIIDDENINFETFEAELSYNIIQRLESTLDIAGLLANIREEYREVLILYYYNGYSYDEISRILAIPLGTVKTYLYRAKQELKKALNI